MKREEPIDLEEYKGERLARKGSLAESKKPVLQPEELRELLDRNLSVKIWRKRS